MRFLIDLNLSPRLAIAMRQAGHDVVHAADLELFSEPDRVVLARAEDDDRIVVSADSDFGTLLARSGATKPSVLYLRRVQGRRLDSLANLILANLAPVQTALEDGSIVVLGGTTVRIRRLPIL